MNQLFTRLPLLLLGLVGFCMPSLIAQPDGLDASDTDDNPCFAIWDTDEDRGKNNNPILVRYIDIFIPINQSYTKYRAVVRFFDQSGNLLAIPGAGSNNGLMQEIAPQSLAPTITSINYPNGRVFTYELNTPFSQSLIGYVSLDFYGFMLNNWLPLHDSNNNLWDVNNPNPRNICWDTRSGVTPQKEDVGRQGEFAQISTWAYPNPTSRNLYVQSAEIQSTLELFDIRGARLESWTLPASTSAQKISVQAFPEGIYYLKQQIGTEVRYGRIQIL